ncbi:MAG: hypothetical protein IKI45_10895 [Oscillospiraceae bacterium]|nr:hypothetical protein [Oscillospiraceae bacterium]
MPHIVLIGDETFLLESFSAMHVPESIRCIRHENQLEIRFSEPDHRAPCAGQRLTVPKETMKKGT